MAVPNQIAGFLFEIWEGPPPQVVTQNLEQFTRGGVDGVGHQRMGIYGLPFTVRLGAWISNFQAAIQTYALYPSLIGQGPQTVFFQWQDYSQAPIEHRYIVNRVESPDIRTRVRLLSNDKNFIGGVELISRWTLTPVYTPGN